MQQTKHCPFQRPKPYGWRAFQQGIHCHCHYQSRGCSGPSRCNWGVREGWLLTPRKNKKNKKSMCFWVCWHPRRWWCCKYWSKYGFIHVFGAMSFWIVKIKVLSFFLATQWRSKMMFYWYVLVVWLVTLKFKCNESDYTDKGWTMKTKVVMQTCKMTAYT